MIGVAEQCFPVFGGDSSSAQAATERMAKIMDANQRQARFAPCLLPGVVVYLPDAPAAIGEEPDPI
jgi:hypothetical protein